MSREQLAGKVISITGEKATVSIEKKSYECSIRKKAKGQKTSQKNILVVGDDVLVSLENEKEGVIERIEKRRTFLTRQDTVQKKSQLIAANVDQALIVVSLVNPPLKPSLVDRYLIACEKGNIEPVLVINKLDLLKDTSFPEKVLKKEEDLYHESLAAYKTLGIPVCPICVETKEGLEKVKKLLEGKTSVLTGQSGTGKTSLINVLFQKDFLVNAPIKRTRKGAHTTTRSSLIPIENEGFVVDTPGIKSFGLWELTKQDILNHFSDIHEISQNCRFANCHHLKEPGCAVVQAYEEKKLSSLRFESYLSLMESIGKKDRWR